jgi:MFS family permease
MEVLLQQVRQWHHRGVIAMVFAVFVFFGFSIGANGVFWKDIMPATGMGEALFGELSLISPLTAVFILLFGGPVIERIGKRMALTIGLFIITLATLSLSASASPLHFALVNLLYGLGYGTIEITVNSVTLDWERERGRSVMNYVHAVFCAGAVISSLLAGQLLQVGVSYAQILWGIAGLGGVLALANLFLRFPMSVVEDGTSDAGAAFRLLRTNSIVFTLSMISFFAAFAEGIAITWSVLHLSNLGASAVIGGFGFALFNTVMFVGRMTNASIVDRFGVVRSIMVSAVAITLAGVLLFATNSLWLAIAAFAILGFGAAGPIPTALTAGAKLVPGQNSAFSGALMSITYMSFIVCAPLIGNVAEWTSLHIALITTIVVGVCLFGFAQRLHVVSKNAV